MVSSRHGRSQVVNLLLLQPQIVIDVGSRGMLV